VPMDPVRLAELRRSYAAGGLAEADLAADPYTQFARWLGEAADAGLTEPNAMVLGTVGTVGTGSTVGTVGPDAGPSARTVLLKGVDADGFVFFTNYTSRKGTELAASPAASLLFPWYDLERQVSVVGTVSRTDRGQTEAYFRSRPYGSRIGAWASRQSAVIAGRQGLDARYAELAARWPDTGPDSVPVPDFWGGFRLVAQAVEFWQGRPSRLHDRLRYVRTPSDPPWTVERLAP
jgi:pyridoxamine 5'-phosphate oxidase